VVHTPAGRRFVLTQVQIRLRNSTGLVIDAKKLDFNLFLSRFELRDIALRGVRLTDLPAPLRAERIEIAIPLWRLIRGSFDTAKIQIDGLTLHLVTGRGGQGNWPPLGGAGSGAEFRGPAVLVTSGDFHLQDDRNGLLLRLPIRRLSGAWDSRSLKYGIACEGAAGSLDWQDARLPIDSLQLKAALAGGDLSLDFLRIASGGSEIAINGSLSGSPARIAAIADLNLDLHDFSQALNLASPTQGRIRAYVTATGLLNALQFKGEAQGGDLLVSGIPIRRGLAEALLDAHTGEVRIQGLSAGIFGGQLIANGRLWTGVSLGRSQLDAALHGLDPRQLARLLGSAVVLPGRPDVEVRASWPGLEWQRASVSGMARSRSAEVAFVATGGPDSIHTSIDSTLGKGAAMHGDIAFGLTDHSLRGIVRGNVDSLAQFGSRLENLMNRPPGSLNLPAVDGAAHWSARLAGTTALPSASLRLDVDGISAGGARGADLQVQADYAVGRIGIESARLTWDGQQIEAKGEIGGTSVAAPLRLAGTVEIHSLAKALGSFGINSSVEAGVSGGFQLSGTLGQPAAETTLQTGTLDAYGVRFSRASIDARWQNGELNVSRLVAEQDRESGVPGHMEASGCLDPATGRYEIQVAARSLRPTAVDLPGGQPLTGTFQIEAHGKGTLGDPVFSAQLNASEVRFGGMAVGELHANIDAAGHQMTALLTAPALNIQATSTIDLEGALPFQLGVDARNTPIGSTLAGSFNAAVGANGTFAPPRLERATAAIDKLRLVTRGQEVLGDGPIKLSLSEDRIRVENLALKSGSSALRISGEMPLRDGGVPGSLSLQGKVNLEPLSQLFPISSAPLIGGTAEVNATVTGSTQHWKPAANVTIRDGRFRWQPMPLAVENINGTLDLQDGVIRLEGISAKAGTGTLQIAGSLPLRLISDTLPAPSVNPTQPARFSGQLDKLELSGGSGEGAVSATIGAKLAGTASALSFPSVRATVEFSELDLISKSSRLQQTGPTRITIADSVASLEHFDVGGAGAFLRANGTMGLTAGFPLKLEAAGQTDLAMLSVLAAPLEAAGTVKLDLRVGGTLTLPQTTGFVELNQASLLLLNPRIQAGGIKLRADLEGDHLTVKELSGNLNGGPFSGGGDLRVSAEGLRDVNLFLKGKDVFTEFPASVKTTSALDVKFVSKQNRLVLGGQIEVQEGYYDSAIDIFSRSNQTLGAGLEPAPGATSNPVALDIRIVTRRPVEMDNNLGRLSAAVDLRLAGTVNKTGLLGTLELDQDGKLYFGDRTYFIERGTVRFRDESKVNPELDIQAYTRTGDYTIKLGLSGKLDEITTTFTSDPPLSRDDVIAVLLTGRTVAENRGVDLRALEATSLATGAMNASLSSQLHRTLGVSRVTIQPAAIAAESNPGARITVTQDFTSALRLLYSMNLSDSNDQIWVGEYDLSRQFTTRVVKQSDNTYRGEFRHDIRFGSSSSAAGNATVKAASRKISRVSFAEAGPFAPEALAKIFKVKQGQQYKAIKVRKGTERLAGFLVKKGYLESRVRLDREDEGQAIGLTVRIELGPAVELSYSGTNLAKRQKSRVRKMWHNGISDQQRSQASKEAILGYFAQKGFLRAQANVHLSNDGGRKLVQFDLQPGSRYTGVRIVVEGAEPKRKREILSLVDERPMKLALSRDPARVADAVTRYYQQRGYLAAKVGVPVQKLDAGRRTGRIVIPVQEGPVYHVGPLQFSGNRALTAAQLQAGLPLESGAVYEPARVEPAAAAIKQKFGKLGFRGAHIDFAIARHDDRASVDVSFIIVENQQTTIGSIEVAGNRHTSDKFARGRLKVAEGEVANTELIRESVKNLSQTGAYTSADIQLRPPVEPGAGDQPMRVADVVVAVAEPKPFRLLYGGLYDSGNGPGFIADFQNHNSLGSGRVLGLRARFDSETNEARIYLTQPTWGLCRLSTTFATYYTHETLYHQSTPTDKLGASIQQDVQLRSKWLLSYGYRYERQRGFVPDPAAPQIPVEVVSVSPVTLTISRDARDSFLDATRGSFVSHGFEFAPHVLGSDYPYVRYYGQYFKYFPLTSPRPVPFGEKPQRSRLVFATGTRLGVQKGFDATGAVLTDRFYAGGGTTVRGFRQDELGPKLANGQPAGGNVVLVLNDELRYPLFWVFDAVTFVDVGNVFPRVTDFRFSDLRTAGGFGLRIRNPFVVLRFDYGFKFNRRPGETIGAFFFSIGQAF